MFGKDYYYCILGWHGLMDYGKLIERDKLCSSTIFADNNYPKTVLLLKDIIEEEYGKIILFCNNETLPSEQLRFADLIVRFPNNCVEWFETHGKSSIQSAKQIAQRYQNRLFLFSIGPVSEVLIYHMYNANPNNRYIDMGSSIDPLLKGRNTRPYHTKFQSCQ